MGKSWALGDRDQLHKDANKALDQNLAPGETVMVIVRGIFDSSLISTDRRVFVFKKGMFSGSAFGSKLSTWDYRNVSGIQLETGPLSGVVAVQAPGAAATDFSFWSSGKDDPAKAPNAVAIRREHFDQARAGVAELRNLLAAAQGTSSTRSAPDVTDQLKKLAELRDAGILTAEEFSTKKAELLARL